MPIPFKNDQGTYIYEYNGNTFNANKPVCNQCGSNNISFSTDVRFDVSTQSFIAPDWTLDNGHVCDDCGAEDDFQWVEITENDLVTK